MTEQPQPEGTGVAILSVSEARHQFNNLPKHFESRPDQPILVDHQNTPVMAIISFAQFVEMMKLQEFLHGKGMAEEFGQWFEAQVHAMQQPHEHVHGEHCQH